MIQSVQELPLILTTNNSDITFSNDELRTRGATCRGWLNHTEGTSQYTILGSGCNEQSNTYEVTWNSCSGCKCKYCYYYCRRLYEYII